MKNTIIKVLSVVMAMVMALGTCIVVTGTAAAADCKHANYEQYGDPEKATCTTWGFTIYRCSDCGDHFKTELNTLEPPHEKLEGHKWLNEKTVDATCIADGYKTRTCSVCNTENTEKTADKSESLHKWDDGVTTDSSCTEAGVKTYTCKTCGKTKTEAIDEKGHTWVAQLDKVIEPKCDEYVDANDPENKKAAYGYMPYKCKNCDATRTVEIMPRDYHVYVFMDKDISGLCGTVYLSQSGKYCKWCYEGENGVEHSVIQHKWVVVEGKEYKAATCEEDGFRTVQCTICKKVVENQIIPALNHEFGTEPTVSVKPTCTKWGYDLYGCIHCGTKFDNISYAPTGHKWAATGNKVEATCTTPGGIEYACENGCGEKKIDADPEAPAKGHNKTLQDVAAVEPTCLEGGYTAGKWCPDCEKYVEGHVALKPLGHANVTYICTANKIKDIVCSRCGTVDKEGVEAIVIEGAVESHVWVTTTLVPATCTTSGTDSLTCKYCGKTVTKTVPALGHKTETTTVNATCMAAGYKLVSCKVCHATISNTVLPVDPEGHIGEVTKYVAPTCTTSGVEIGNCVNCGKYYEKSLAKLGHDQVNIEAKAATCIEAGNTAGSYCKRCNEVFVKSETIKALGHDEKTIAGYAATCTTKGLSEGKECKRCGEITVKQVEIAKIDHYTTLADGTKVQFAGAGTDYTANCKTPSIGFDVHECDYCDEAYIDAYRDALDHTWGELQHKAVNCVEDGYDYYKCTADGCNATKEVENTRVKAEGHKDKNGNVISTSCVRPADIDNTCVNKFCPDADKKIDIIHEDKFAGHVNATCQIYAHDIFVCTVCERKEIKNIVDTLADHKKKEVSKSDAPTFEKAQKIVEKCEVCGEVFETYKAKMAQFKATVKNITNADEKVVNGTKKIQVTIAIRSDKREIHSFIGAFTFNKDHLEFIDATCSKTIAGMAASIDAYNIKADNKDTGKVNITAFVNNDADNKVVNATLTGEFETLVTLNFKVKGTAYAADAASITTSMALTIDNLVNKDEKQNSPNLDEAKPSVVIYKLGDVNGSGDGKVNNSDYLAIQKLIEADKYDARADLNGDGKVSAEDLASLQKILVARYAYNDVANARK